MSWYIVSFFLFFPLKDSLNRHKKTVCHHKTTVCRPQNSSHCGITTELFYISSLCLSAVEQRWGTAGSLEKTCSGLTGISWDIPDRWFLVRVPRASFSFKCSFITYACHRYVAFANALQETITGTRWDMQYVGSLSNSWLVEQLSLMSCWSAGLRSMFPFIKYKLHIYLN